MDDGRFGLLEKQQRNIHFYQRWDAVWHENPIIVISEFCSMEFKGKRGRNENVRYEAVKEDPSVNLMSRIRNRYISENCESRSFLKQVNKSILKRFGHTERIYEGRITKKYKRGGNLDEV